MHFTKLHMLNHFSFYFKLTQVEVVCAMMQSSVTRNVVRLLRAPDCSRVSLNEKKILNISVQTICAMKNPAFITVVHVVISCYLVRSMFLDHSHSIIFVFRSCLRHQWGLILTNLT